MAKPTRAALLTLGLPPPAAASPPCLVEQVDAAAGLLFYSAALLDVDDALDLVLHRDSTLGAPASLLPAGLAEGVTYYARPATAGSFALALGPSPAAAIASFADEGRGRFSFRIDPGAALDMALTDAWDTVLADCTAHGGDVEAPIITLAAKFLAVRLYVAHMAAGDPEKAASYDGIASLYADVYAPKLAAYFRGAPVRGAVDATPGAAEQGAFLVPMAAGLFDGRCMERV